MIRASVLAHDHSACQAGLRNWPMTWHDRGPMGQSPTHECTTMGVGHDGLGIGITGHFQLVRSRCGDPHNVSVFTSVLGKNAQEGGGWDKNERGHSRALHGLGQ